MTNSQRNEALTSVVGSKNPKIRVYGGSESNDFRVACGVAQTNLRNEYVNQTLEVLNIKPGKYCTEYNDRMTTSLQCRRILASEVASERILIKRAPSWIQTRKRLGERRNCVLGSEREVTGEGDGKEKYARRQSLFFRERPFAHERSL